MKNFKRLGLGTVQWGLPYGVNNQKGVPAEETISELLKAARKYGLEILDTASQYGKSEAVLGANSLEGFKVVTKTPSFNKLSIIDTDAKLLTETFQQSLNLLSCKKIYAILIHNVNDLLVRGGELLINAILNLKEKGLVDKVGVSVYDSMQVDAVMKKFKPDIIQLPLNIFDQRMLKSGHLAFLKDKGVEIHVRSIFLQGLLLMPLDNIPSFFDPIRPLLLRWHKITKKNGLTANQVAIGFIKNIPEIDTVLVGFDNVPQFQSCIESFKLDINIDVEELACNDIKYITPSFWNLG